MQLFGTMQLGVFQQEKVYCEVGDLLGAINEVNPFSHVIFSGLILRPIDFPRSRSRCDSYSRAYEYAVGEYRRTKGWNCGFVPVDRDFMELHMKIPEPDCIFVDGLYLSLEGIRILRDAWLRYLGFFPKKASDLVYNPVTQASVYS